MKELLEEILKMLHRAELGTEMMCVSCGETLGHYENCELVTLIKKVEDELPRL